MIQQSFAPLPARPILSDPTAQLSMPIPFPGLGAAQRMANARAYQYYRLAFIDVRPFYGGQETRPFPAGATNIPTKRPFDSSRVPVVSQGFFLGETLL